MFNVASPMSLHHTSPQANMQFSGHYRILHAEDSSTIRKSIEDALLAQAQETGDTLEITQVDSFPAARTVLEQTPNPFDLIITDNFMPTRQGSNEVRDGNHGIALLRYVNENVSPVPQLVMYSGDKSAKPEAIALGAKFFDKNYNPDYVAGYILQAALSEKK